MKRLSGFFIGVLFIIRVCSFARGDIVVGTDGKLTDGKIVSSGNKEIVIQPDGDPTTRPVHIDRANASRVVYTDEHGAMIPPPAPTGAAPATQPAANWNVPREPATPPIVAVAAPSYYVIPLHGEVGATLLASALEKSFADAVARKPTVVVLDIDSPGGSVAESEKIIQIIHHYNKLLRIVALTNQDLSAAAIFSLSCKTIYVKPTSTIGAATSFIPGHPDLSAKVEEKMQSAWRAVARNSAEEGGHEPLLTEAMIDNTISLHLEIVDGKPVVKMGDGDKMLCRKGQILTLTSHEAIECGLAAGDAEDFAALGEALGFANWTECKGLGTVLADFLPTLDTAFTSQEKKIAADFSLNILAAATADPTQQNSYVIFQNGPQRPVAPRMPIPGRPMRPGMQPVGPPAMQQPGQQTQVVRTSEDIRHWKQRSLACVVAIDQAEQNLRDAISLCTAFGHTPEADAVNDSLTSLSAVRAKMYDDRNKYGDGTVPPQNLAQPGLAAGNRPGAPARLGRGAATLPVPSDDAAAAQFKKIDAGWQPTTEKPVDLLPTMQSVGNDKYDDGSIMLGNSHNVTSTDKYQAPVTFRIVALTNGGDLRIAFPADQIIFNWEMNPNQLRVDGGPANGKYKDGAGKLPAGEWVGIEMVVNPDELIIYVDGEERYRQKADFTTIDRTLSITGHGGLARVKSVSVIKR